MMDFKKYINNTTLLKEMFCVKFYITIINGHLQSNLSKLPKGIRNFNIDDLSNTDYLNSMGGVNKSGFVIDISPSTKLSEPIYINHIIDKNHKETNNSNIVYLVKNDSKISFVEKIYGTDIKAANQPIVKKLNSIWIIEKDAELFHYSFMPEGLHEDSEIINTLNVKQKQKSNSSFYSFYWNNAKIHNHLNIQLDEAEAKCNLFSISILLNNSLVDNSIAVNHNAPECESQQIYKGIFNDKSIGKFNSTVFVAKNAQKTLSKQKNNNILLSDYCSVGSNPQLEIYADDVKCEHGSTIGQIDLKSLFYLRSRGLSEKMASSMLLNAFLSEIIQEISDEKIKKSVLVALNKQLELMY